MLQKLSLIGLMIGLAACGQTSGSTGQPISTTQRQTHGAAPTASTIDTENIDWSRSPYTLAAIDAELDRMALRDCPTSETQAVDGIVYDLCAGANGQPLRVVMDYASGSLSRYWFQDDGTFYAHDDYIDGTFTRKVLVGDGKTIVLANGQGEWDVVEDASDWEYTLSTANMAVVTVQSGLARGQALTSMHNDATKSVGLVKLARTGGNDNHRWATLVVPQSSTAVSAEGGAMRWYDLHLATMVALTADQFCGNPSARGAYFHYEANGGSVYMGQYFIPCNTAKDLMNTFGRERDASVFMEEAGINGEVVDQRIPALSDAVMPQFRRQVVDALTPECSGAGRCPGDRL